MRKFIYETVAGEIANDLKVKIDVAYFITSSGIPVTTVNHTSSFYSLIKNGTLLHSNIQKAAIADFEKSTQIAA